MRDIELLEKLRATGKDFFTVSDLKKVTGLERESLYVALSRLSGKGVLRRAARGVYLLPDTYPPAEKIATQLYFPCYLSFESALSRAGVLGLVPYVLTFATPRKTRRLRVLEQVVEYRRLREDLFFGFELAEGYYLARPEKALLDALYLAAYGKGSLPESELDLSLLDR
ncbi:type IV toxin-antitoxin system AbiEi family antitoxin domain-containing protein, partial [Candidatus Solincola tengchongensis]|uniref:type IV toxin-antitoxin system AbiEi family antitoxin domain-containing protein n=1 Tax=Candidatus Solincola tengchongensis TaxID=2900693 RepID=UPI0025810BAC